MKGKNGANYQKIDLETWPRRSHFEYYRNQIPCLFSVTAKIDVTAILAYAHRTKRHFYGCMIYAIAKTVNEMDQMKLFLLPNKTPAIYDVRHPVFTIFHPENETFSDLWTEYDPDFDTFYAEFERVRNTYGTPEHYGIKGRPDQPENFFCVSCVPWLDFTSASTLVPGGEPQMFPIIHFGKYTRDENGKVTMPVALTIGHAAADGYHAGRFFEGLQGNLDKIGENR
ncbi:MAG: CatA-like O-acetyltransferase [Lachnospiraceae bacterium]